MDEPRELTQAQRAELHVDLRALETELSASIERSVEESKPVDLDTPIGRLSRIDAIAQREISAAGRRQQIQQLARVRSALATIGGDEQFGLCTLCDEPIAFRRLKARPFSTICLRCQAAREHRG
ncbi:MAG: TraR/DksA C4-type zinc finger protein [Deltaproteobacteria bacterium]|nr:TraR/DksA C4-type zinc finger protein [Deltaproteobacteria bacterium]